MTLLCAIAPGLQEHLCRYDDEIVVFNPHTWQTHILNAAAALVVEALCTEPHSIDSLHARLTSDLDPGDMAVFDKPHLLALLRELTDLHLVVSAESAA